MSTLAGRGTGGTNPTTLAYFRSTSVTDTPRYRDGFLAAVYPGKAHSADEMPNGTQLEPAASAFGESLSAEEQIKRRLHPLDSFPQLLDCVEANRPPDADDQFRFQWFGLFYQAPQQDAFLLRLRLPGGWLETFQLAALANITQELAGGHVLLNPQGGLDIPGVPVRAAAEILRRTEGIGLSARQTGGDCVQCIRAGIMADDPRAPVRPLVGTLEQALLHSRTLADLPRGCEIVLRRVGEWPEADWTGEIETVILQEVPAPDGGPWGSHASAFLLVVPGDLKGGFLLPQSRTVSGCLKLLDAWATGADRTSRQRAGLDAFCGALGRERISSLLENAPWQPWQNRREAGAGFPGEKLPCGFAIPDGRLLSGQLIAIEKIIRDHGLGGVRLIRGCLHLAQAVDDAVRGALNVALAAG